MRSKKRTETNVFSLSFLDIIACGFGAIVLLLLIVKVGEKGTDEDLTNDDLLKKLFSLQDRQIPLDSKVNSLNQRMEDLRLELNKEESLKLTKQEGLNSIRNEQIVIDKIKSRLTSAQQTLTDEMKALLNKSERDVEVGGIPVDSEYIIFVIDNSGSMQTIWPKVLSEIENILDIHPEVKGFNVLNDQGKYLMSGYQGAWMKDSPSMRQSVMKLLKNPANLGISYSNPVEGIKKAVSSHYQRGSKISLYVFGDDIRAESLDQALNEIDRINKAPIRGGKKFRIHGVAFVNSYQLDPVRFSHFMRQLSKRNDGTFLALPY
jgi:hypothetical protein